jgi:HD-GYP domain-containing protein (c-di-GMP phosphodiesterase class II)
MNRLSAADIRVGEPIQWDCYDAAGTLLLRKGVLVASERQIEGLIARGLFVTQKAAAPDVNVPRPTEKSSPFYTVEEFKGRLRGIFDAISTAQGGDIPERIMKLTRDLQAVCDMDADAVLGMMHLDTESRYTIMHPLYVAILSELIARVKKLSVEERLPLVAAALTANISIIDLQEQLQKQEGPLTDEQKIEMRLHPVKAVDMLLAIGVQDEAWIATVLHHHEKIDGSGYPGAQRGDAIPLSVRILSLADTYSAMVTPRVYRTSILARDALRDIFLKRGGEMDAVLAQLFIKVLGVFPPGTFVKLQNGETGIVTRRGENTMKPIVHAVIGPRGAPFPASLKRDTAQGDYAITEMVVRDRAVKLNVHRMWGY